MLSNRLNMSEELVVRNRRVQNSSNSRRANRSPIVDPNDKKYMHCIKPADLRKRKLSGSKGCQSMRYDSQSQSRRNVKDDDLHEIYEQLIALKGQYRTMRQNYNNLLLQKTRQIDKVEELTAENTKLRKQIEKLRSQYDVVAQEMSRVKKQSSYLVQIQQFKNKKLQQTLEQKGNMYNYSERVIKVLKNKLGYEEDQQNIPYSKQNIGSGKKMLSKVLSDDSLTFSKEKEVKFIGSPRSACPDLLQEEPEVEECRFYPLQQHVFKKKMNEFEQGDDIDEQVFESNKTELLITSGAKKKRSTTGLNPKKKPDRYPTPHVSGKIPRKKTKLKPTDRQIQKNTCR